MSQQLLRTRLRVEALESRTVPAVLAEPADVIKAEDHTAAISRIDIAQIDSDAPLQVSLAAVAVIAACVGWDRRTREGRHRRSAK